MTNILPFNNQDQQSYAADYQKQYDGVDVALNDKANTNIPYLVQRKRLTHLYSYGRGEHQLNDLNDIKHIILSERSPQTNIGVGGVPHQNSTSLVNRRYIKNLVSPKVVNLYDSEIRYNLSNQNLSRQPKLSYSTNGSRTRGGRIGKRLEDIKVKGSQVNIINRYPFGNPQS